MGAKKMKFMCLHGTFGSKKNYTVQLGPFTKELEKDADWEFIEGPEYTPEPPGFEGFFGPPPHYRFLDDNNVAANAMTNRIREFPEETTPENALRALVPDGMDRTKAVSPQEKLQNWLFDQMDRIGDVDGILGYSEGGLVSASLLLEDQRRVDMGHPRRIKAAIFFFGWPPLNRDGLILLSDETDIRIRIPTVHVIGGADPYLDGSKALYNMCDPATARLFDHGRGHTIPREPRTVVELGVTIRDLIKRAGEADEAEKAALAAK